MELSGIEEDMLAGRCGEPRRIAIEQQLAVGRFYDAEDFVAVSQAHIMADGEAVGDAGVLMLEQLAAAAAEERRVMVPAITDPRGVDPSACTWLRQPGHAPDREARIVGALEAMGVLMTNTCINYQVIMAPVKGEHVAFGDTGSTIYANSVCGARSNFEGGVAALWAALTGRVPRYGYHLDEVRRGTRAFELDFVPGGLTDWGALGGVIGRRMGSYWDVPVIIADGEAPGSDALKHLGAALASYGSTPMFHLVGVTPEAPDLQAACGGRPSNIERIGRADLDVFIDGFDHGDGSVDVVVFAAPQLSLLELEQLARLLDGRRIASTVALLAAVPPEVKRAGERMGIVEPIEAAGGRVLEGVCFYQMYAREMGELNGWKRLVTNSAKLANIIGGYGYVPVLASMERCVDAAIAGRT